MKIRVVALLTGVLALTGAGVAAAGTAAPATKKGAPAVVTNNLGAYRIATGPTWRLPPYGFGSSTATCPAGLVPLGGGESNSSAGNLVPRNLASTAAGATVTGDGVNLDAIADDTEATDWASLDGVAGKQVTIDLAGTGSQPVNQINVSALLRPAVTGDADPGTQNRFSALRSFELLACNADVADCSTDPASRTTTRPRHGLRRNSPLRTQVRIAEFQAFSR